MKHTAKSKRIGDPTPSGGGLFEMYDIFDIAKSEITMIRYCKEFTPNPPPLQKNTKIWTEFTLTVRDKRKSVPDFHSRFYFYGDSAHEFMTYIKRVKDTNVMTIKARAIAYERGVKEDRYSIMEIVTSSNRHAHFQRLFRSGYQMWLHRTNRTGPSA